MRSGVTLRQDDAGMTCGAISRHMTRLHTSGGLSVQPIGWDDGAVALRELDG